MPSVAYTAIHRFNPDVRPDWAKYVAWAQLPQLREVVSLDTILCPNWFRDLIDEDWRHNVQADFKTHLFHDLDYVCARVAGEAVDILALLESPSADDVASFHDPRFEFCGLDLIEDGGGVSALVNCGGFDRAFSPSELSACGLLVDPARAIAVRDALRAEYPSEPHAHCVIWAISRMIR